jgi:5'-nucleotidase
MRRGGDEYTVFAQKAVDAYDFGAPLDQVFIDYLVNNSPISQKIEGRITRK